MTDFPTDKRPVEELETALQEMRTAKSRNLYDDRRIRFGLAKNIRFHEKSVEEAQDDKDDVQEEYVKRDDQGRRVLMAPDGRHVIELEEGEYVYKENAEPYVSEDDRHQQIRLQGQEVSRAQYKQASLRRAWEDVEAMQDKLDDIGAREVEVAIHVLDGTVAKQAVQPQVDCNEEAFLYLFHDFREMVGLPIGGFEPEGREENVQATEEAEA